MYFASENRSWDYKKILYKYWIIQNKVSFFYIKREKAKKSARTRVSKAHWKDRIDIDVIQSFELKEKIVNSEF